MSVAALGVLQVRRLALHAAGLLQPLKAGLPARAGRDERSARRAALAHIGRSGYLQLDSVSVAGARSHALVLLSRIDGLPPGLAETLLQPGEPLFEYWGHEACWLPLELYPCFEFRRRAFRSHPWWGDVIGRHPGQAEELLARIKREGPLRSVDFAGPGGQGWWNLSRARRIAAALWSSGELAIRERRNFQRVYDLAERVIPARLRERPLPVQEALPRLLLKALEGHGWAPGGLLARTWRLRNRAADLADALERLRGEGAILPCALIGEDGRREAGWIRPADLELAEAFSRRRPDPTRARLLSPFDPLLWERARVRRLFGFDYAIEIYKPPARRIHGYYSLPVLAGEALVARVDLKAHRRQGRLEVLACHREAAVAPALAQEAARRGVERLARALALEPDGMP
jgi:uncharacterized protein